MRRVKRIFEEPQVYLLMILIAGGVVIWSVLVSLPLK